MSKESTVTIPLSEYDKLREFYKLKSNPKKVCLSIEYDYANGVGNVVLISESKLIEELQHRINELESKEYWRKHNEEVEKTKKQFVKRWFQL